MKVVEKERYVPARTCIDKIYVASDGKEFYFKDDCLSHEKRLAIESHPIYTSAIQDVSKFYGEDVILYYLSNKEDYEFFKEIQGIDSDEYHFNSDFDKYGEGWYLYWVEDGGDYLDYTFLENYNAYEKEMELSWEKYKSDMRSRMKIKK